MTDEKAHKRPHVYPKIRTARKLYVRCKWRLELLKSGAQVRFCVAFETRVQEVTVAYKVVMA